MTVAVLVMVKCVTVKYLEQTTENLPKVRALIEASEIDIAVLIAMCEEMGTTAQELANMFKEDRAAVVQRHLGPGRRVTNRFLAWKGSKFLARGYPAEEFLTEYLQGANNVNEAARGGGNA